ncbi:glycoside hydrolase family 26 protein [Frankia sp. QA3]|uniref:glycoside hydrolase family 26 protein n=1 Tax=Frankia sp. QA3 TaxID=710111 RepID=UPI0002D615DA|nr:glycosyl hydrolase [Frankia sp. QA3]
MRTDRTGSDRLGAGRTGSDRAAPDRVRPERVGPDRGGPDRVALDRVGPGRIAPDRVRSGRSGPAAAGSGRAGSGRVESGRSAAAKGGPGRGGRAAWTDDEVWSDEVGSARASEAAKAGARHTGRPDDRAATDSGPRARAAAWIIAHWGGNASRIPHLPVIAVSVAVVLTLVAVTALLLVPSGSDGGSDPIATSAGSGASPAAQPGTAARPTQSSVPAAAVPQVERAATTGLFPTGVAAHTLAQANAWARFRGRPNDVVVMYTERSSWSAITDPWMGRSASTFSGYAGTWVITQPLFPDSGAQKGNLADCAAGNYDAKWRQFGRWLMSMGRGDSFVRLGWEFNGLWFAWAATDPQQWIQCFRNASSAIKATSPQVRIDWNLNAHGSTTPVGAFDLYPGDQYVDVIGIDSYDQYPPSPTYADFDNQCNGDAGLCQVITFARTHHKLFSVPEWGVVSQQGTKAGRGGAAGGDNPAYMEKMYETFAHNADILAYEAYFPDAEEGNVRSSLVNPNLNPASAAVYQRLWG